eukprot:gene9472-1714_t
MSQTERSCNASDEIEDVENNSLAEGSKLNYFHPDNSHDDDFNEMVEEHNTAESPSMSDIRQDQGEILQDSAHTPGVHDYCGSISDATNADESQANSTETREKLQDGKVVEEQLQQSASINTKEFSIDAIGVNTDVSDENQPAEISNFEEVVARKESAPNSFSSTPTSLTPNKVDLPVTSQDNLSVTVVPTGIMSLDDVLLDTTPEGSHVEELSHPTSRQESASNIRRVSSTVDEKFNPSTPRNPLKIERANNGDKVVAKGEINGKSQDNRSDNDQTDSESTNFLNFAESDMKPMDQLEDLDHGADTNDETCILDDGQEESDPSQEQEQKQQQENFPKQTIASDSLASKNSAAYGSDHNDSREQIVRFEFEGKERTVRVAILSSCTKKPFLGGYRNKKTTIEYHNASTQTPRRYRIHKTERFTRTTQTSTARTHPKFATQTTVNTATQMTKEGIHITSQMDRILSPKPYITAAETFERKLAAVIVIQKFYRRWKAARFVKSLRIARQKFYEWVAEKDAARQEFDRMLHEREIDRRTNPRTAQDFDLLYNRLHRKNSLLLNWLNIRYRHNLKPLTDSLEFYVRLALCNQLHLTLSAVTEWYEGELAKIPLLPEQEQPKARLVLLQEETKSVTHLKQLAVSNNHETEVQRFLDKTCSGRSWINKEYGKKVHLETPESKIACELRDIYNLIKIPDLDVDERLDALLQLKEAVEKHPGKLTREILELIQREADLLGRHTRVTALEGLRNRILHLFLEFIETPEYNPEAGRYMEVHQDKEFFKHNLVRCAGSQKFYTTSKFEVSPEKRTGLGKSKAVLAVENHALYCEDNAVYKQMLNRIRKIEAGYSGLSQCMLLISVRDLKYIIETIWGGKSCLSEDTNLNKLTLCRWDKRKELTPWNCILLSNEEVPAHEYLEDPESSYGPEFVARVRQKHIRAKQHFHTLQGHLANARRKRALPSKPIEQDSPTLLQYSQQT